MTKDQLGLPVYPLGGVTLQAGKADQDDRDDRHQPDRHEGEPYGRSCLGVIHRVLDIR